MTELVHRGSFSELEAQKKDLGNLNTLVMDTAVTCQQLERLAKMDFASNLEYLLFYNLDCNIMPSAVLNFVALEKLIINSNTLDHFPEALTQLPALKHLQLETMEYQTFLGKVSDQCRLEEIEFQTTPIKALGNLSQIPTLKRVAILDNEEFKDNNEKIEVVRD